MVKIVLGLGSNTGRRLLYLRSAVKTICSLKDFSFIAVSGIYETEPWGYRNQNMFLNCILVCRCTKSPEETLKILKGIESALGRKPRAKWQQREIDIDILFYGQKVYKKGALEIPHPGIEFRNFVLAPLRELMPDFVHPKIHKSVNYLFENSTDKSRVKLIKEKIKG